MRVLATTLPLGVVPWFPQDQAAPFFIAKGLIALLSTVLLLFHMTKEWGRMQEESTRGQRMRYITLLAFSVLVTGGSAEQVTEETLVSYRHLGAAVVALLLLVTVIISMRERPTR